MKLSIKQVLDIVDKMPDAQANIVLENFARMDPWIFCAFYRKLRGYPLTFSASKELTPASLADLAKEFKDPDIYQQQLKTRRLRHRPFLIQPLRDTHRHKVYQKSRQVGVSELSITETAHFLWSNPGKKWIYTFPRDTQLKEFSVTRITEMFNETDRTKSMLTAPPATYVRRIGSSYLILRSAWESQLGEGVDADGVTFDEKDRMREGVELAFIESMKSSAFSRLREVSTPTLPGRGVNKSFMDSDQHCWLMRCERCNLEQEILWPDNFLQLKDYQIGTVELEPGTYEFRCKKSKCRGRIDRMKGRWVAKYPQKKAIRGYYIPQMIAAWIDATDMVQERLKRYKGFMQLWTNYVLGLPAQGDSVLVSDGDFVKACAGHQMLTHRTADWDSISVGIDWGHLNWCVVFGRNVHNNQKYILAVNVFPDSGDRELEAAKRVEEFFAPFQPDIVIADAGYGKDRNDYLRRRMPGRFYACWYNPSSKASRTFVPVWSPPEAARLLVDRTMTLKRTCQAIQYQEFGLPDLDLELMKVFQKHFGNIASMRTEEDGEIFEEIQNSGDDHFVHATAYGYIGIDHMMKEGAMNFAFI